MTFDAKDLIRVLRACNQARVSELKIGNIEVKFVAGETVQTKIRPSEVDLMTDQELKEAEQEVNISENLTEAEDRLDLLQIDDPSLYEQLVIERELEDRGRNEITLD